MDSAHSFSAWQWNCRGFLNKKASLHQLIRSMGVKPKVIILQETLADEVKLTGYKSVCRQKNCGRGLATLVDKKLPFIEHDIHLGLSKIEYALVEIVLKRHKGRAQSIFCLNIYSSPTDKKQTFRALFNKALAVAKSSPLIIGGDFNGPVPRVGIRLEYKERREVMEPCHGPGTVPDHRTCFPHPLWHVHVQGLYTRPHFCQQLETS